MTDRLQNLRRQFKPLDVDGFLVTFQPHVRYLTGFSGSNGLGIVTRRGAFFITDGRYTKQAAQEVRGWKIFIASASDSLFTELKKQDLLRVGSRVGFDGNTVTLVVFRQLRKMLTGIHLLPKVNVVEHLAVVKDTAEIGTIKKAVAITDKVFSDILPLIRPGVRETDIAAEITYRQRKYGAEADAFESIVASGERGALPHGKASSKKIRKGEMVTLDFGCVYEGYHSDLTRTVAVGKPSSQMKKVYQIVLDAQVRAIEAARSGMKTRELDAIARSHIKARGYEKFFQHALGHGIGLQIHEAPRISVQSKSVLASGNVVTIEPGIYIPNVGGVRIEDDIVITNGECHILNRSPKHLITL